MSTRRRQPGGWGTTQQLPSGRWRAFYRREGERITAPDTFDTKAAALAWLATERAEHARGTWVDPRAGSVTLGEYARDWLRGRADLAPRTRDLYARLFRTWLLVPLRTEHGRTIDLGATPLASLTPASVRTWHGVLVRATNASALSRRQPDARRLAHPARRWAAAHGLEVAPSGRLSPDLLATWRAAGSPVPPAPTRATTMTPDRAGRSTAAKVYTLLHVILGAAVADGLLRDNPCRIPGAGQQRTPERSTASPAEVAALAAAMPADLAAAVTVAAWSSLRYGELFALARRHVDLEAGTVRVERTVLDVAGEPLTFGRPKTTKSRRTVHLPAFVVAALAEHMAEHTAADPDALVFHRHGGPLSRAHLSRHFRRACAVVGRDDLTWHDLRHTGATLAYRTGASVPEVQARLGHTTMRAAMIYAHAADDSDRLMAERLHDLYASTQRAPRLRAV